MCLFSSQVEEDDVKAAHEIMHFALYGDAAMRQLEVSVSFVQQNHTFYHYLGCNCRALAQPLVTSTAKLPRPMGTVQTTTVTMMTTMAPVDRVASEAKGRVTMMIRDTMVRSAVFGN